MTFFFWVGGEGFGRLGGLLYFVPLAVCVCAFVLRFCRDWLRWMNHIAFLKTVGMIRTEAKSGDVFGKCNSFHFFLNNCWRLKPISPVADTLC